jgi:hypothetical protein
VKHYILSTGFAAATLLCSCSNNEQPRKTGPIVMGDSSTIVTETDSQYLGDLVADIELAPAKVAAPTKEQAALPEAVKKDTVKAEATPKGYEINCGTYSIILTGIDAKEYKKQNPETASSLSFARVSGNIEKAKIVLTGNVKNLSVKQRYQSQLLLDGSQGKLALPDLGLFTSGWSTQSVAGNSVSISGLSNLQFVPINNRKLTNAADRALRKKKASAKAIQTWMKEIRKVNNAGDKPSVVVLNNVQWQISGVDKAGKAFTKTVRLDIPQ